MKILSNITMAGNVSMASSAKDEFTIGSELERDNADADNLKVWANSNFYNDVTIGSSSADLLTINSGQVLLSGSTFINSSIRNFYVAKNGSDTNSGTSSADPLLTIQAAVDKVGNFNSSATTRSQYHTIINIASGSYSEKVNVTNKGSSGKLSNQLILFQGEREILQDNLTGSSIITTDPDSGRSEGLTNNGIVLNITPTENSLVGNFLLGKDGSTVGVIVEHSGSNFYFVCDAIANLSNAQTYFSGSGLKIFKPTTEVTGYFKCVGNQGTVAFRDLKINTTVNDGGGTTNFGLSGFDTVIGTIDTGSTGVTTGTGFNASNLSTQADTIYAENCQIVRTSGTNFVLAPRSHFRHSYFLSGTLSIARNETRASFQGCFLNGSNISTTAAQTIDMGYSCMHSATFTATSCNYILLGKKYKSTTLNISTTPAVVSSFATSYKSSKILLTDAHLVHNAATSFIGPWANNALYSIRDSKTIFNNTFYMSGAVEDVFATPIFLSDSLIQFASTSDFSNVSYTYDKGILIGYRSDFLFDTSTPLTASTSSPLYKATQIVIDEIGKSFSDLSFVTIKGSTANLGTSAATKVFFSDPLVTTSTISGSSTLDVGGTATFGSNLNIYGNLGTSNGANQTKTIYAECTNGTVIVGGSGTTVSGSKAQFASLNLNSSQIETAWSSYNVSWTSSGTQPSLGNGTLTGYYKQIGKTVFVRVKLDWGSTTTGGTGDWRFSLPVSAVSSEAIQMPCSILDNGNAWYQATVNGRYSGLTDRSSLIGQSSTNNSSQGITSTFPITWGDGDSLQFNGSYEAA